MTRWRAELSATLTLAWPLVLAQLAEIGVGTLLILLAGRLGAAALAATTLGFETFHALFLFGLGLAIAVSPLVAQARGRGDFRSVRRATRQGLWACTLVSLPSMALLWFVEPLLLALAQPPDVAAAAADFCRPLTFGLAPWLWFYAIRNFMAAMDRPRPGLYVMLLALPATAGLGHALTFGLFGLPGLGVAGAGLTMTLIGWLAFLSLLLFLRADARLRRFRVLGRLWRADWPLLRELLRLGLPISVALLFEILLFVVAIYLQGLISVVSQAAHGLALQIVALPFMAFVGLGQAATIRIGLAIGRGRPAEASANAAVTYALGSLCAVSAASAYLLWPDFLLGLFLEAARGDTPAIIATGTTFLVVAAFFQLFDGAQVLAMGCLRGLKDTRVPMLIAALGYWGIGLPAAVLLAFATDLAGLGIWLGLAAGLAVAGVLLTLRVRNRLAGLGCGAGAS